MGRKRSFKSNKWLEQTVEKYFADCQTEEKMPTVAGLALALGFHCRQALDRYTDRSEIEPEDKAVQIITRAKCRIEEANLQAAYHKDSSQGARFVLQNGFGYAEKKDFDVSSQTIEVKVE